MNWFNQEPEKKDFELIPNGKYVAILENAQLDATSEPHKLKVTYVLKDEKFGNRKLWQNFTYSDKSAKFLVWQMGVLGVQSQAKSATSEKEYYKAITDGVFELAKSNAAVVLEVTSKEYNGKTYNNVIISDLHDGDLPVRNHALDVEGSGNPPLFDNDEEITF